MSHFEYVSVAMALLNALVVARLLSGLAPALDHRRRYWVHAAWVFALVLIAALQWWSFWSWRQVAWTPIRFLWGLSLPGLLFVTAAVLLGDDPGSVASFRDHFFRRRVLFFSLSMASGVNIALGPWVLGQWPWFTPRPVHVAAASLMALSLAGLGFRSHTAHATIVALGLLLVGASFLLPISGPAD